jgi:tricorn protease
MQGYYRFPTINKDSIIFVSEDDLWRISLKDTVARRLTSNLAAVRNPFLSPDGEWVAFTGQEEGHPEVYLMPSSGGIAERLTYLGANTYVAGWSRDGRDVIFASDHGQPFRSITQLYLIRRDDKNPRRINVGNARSISFGPKKGAVIGRNMLDPARWKRYRGGTVGEIWIDRRGDGDYRKIVNLKGNFARPMWIGDRIYFIGDHEGVGNLYSCTPDGKGIRRETHHTEFYVRSCSSDAENIVYHAGADLYVYSPRKRAAKKIAVKYLSPRVQTNRKFVPANFYLEDYRLQAKGELICVTSRGKVFHMQNWSGPVFQLGNKPGARYRLPVWLNAGKKIVLITDEKGEDAIQIRDGSNQKPPVTLPFLDIGSPLELVPSPNKPLIALTNHRQELILVNLKSRKRYILDKSKYNRITGLTWSPDGNWLAYAHFQTSRSSGIKLCEVNSRKTYSITRPVRFEFSPSFDPDGKYLYYLADCNFEPVYDTNQFGLGFPANTKILMITLQKDLVTPFKYGNRPQPDADAAETSGAKKRKPKFKIDLDNIADRVISVPVPAARYFQVSGMKDKILFASQPVEGVSGGWREEDIPAKAVLEYYDLISLKRRFLVAGITDFKTAPESDLVMYRVRDRLRIVKAMEKFEEEISKDHSGPASGWLDLNRIRILVAPALEWRQMFRDVWRLQRDHFWNRNMSGIDWKRIYDRYFPLLSRVGSRAEFSDLIWEMQGELGTSHAYEFGGDYRPEPAYHQGFLGADLKYEPGRGYRILKIVRGDPWDEVNSSPLIQSGINIKEGDLILEVDGKKVDRVHPPAEFLMNRPQAEVALTIAGRAGRRKRQVTVKTLASESAARYRDWVEANREAVHRLGKGRIGYVHLPDMGPRGYAEFHRYFLTEIHYPGLIVDVRYNGGGHVSQLILEKLRRERIGYDVNRWGQPEPYPNESVLGPMVAITNEHAGSDGDIFSHCFKLYKLGPLIGKRTWGGVVGINPYYSLSDGGLTTQPEFSFWFKDVGWGVENYGTDPDIEVEYRPQDYARGRDPQLERALKECNRLVRIQKPKVPDFGKKPLRTIPKRLK